MCLIFLSNVLTMWVDLENQKYRDKVIQTTFFFFCYLKKTVLFKTNLYMHIQKSIQNHSRSLFFLCCNVIFVPRKLHIVLLSPRMEGGLENSWTFKHSGKKLWRSLFPISKYLICTMRKWSCVSAACRTHCEPPAFTWQPATR